MDPTYYARNEAPLREGAAVISKIPQRIKGKRIPRGSAGVIIARDGDHETYVVAFCKIATAVTLKRNEIEPKLAL